ncbi:MAG: dodecin flavoprotein [Phenylobacterium zucineum]|nr:MAG: dodecin flavoprotein [Phenylobacterium zucineum]
MSESNTYGVSEIVGSSPTSIDDAIRTAISKATENRRHLRWFEVTQIRGHIEEGEVAHFQTTLKLGYTIED